MPELSSYSKRLIGQPMFKLLDNIKEFEKKGRKFIHLEIGDPDFETPQVIKNECIKSIRKGHTHYSSSSGDIKLCEAITNYYKGCGHTFVELNNIVISPGCNPLIYAVAQCLLNQHDEVLLCDPCFPTYDSIFHLLGIKVNRYPLTEENNFQIMEDLPDYFTPKTKMFIINSPNNPTGSILNRKSMERAQTAAAIHQCMVVSDEIYQMMDYEHCGNSILSVSDSIKNMIVISGFSKCFAMSGWRIGYLIAPDWLSERISLWMQTTVSCTNTFVQKAASIAFKEEALNDVGEMRKEFKQRRDYLFTQLNRIKGFSCLKPNGGFYFWVNISKTGLSDSDVWYKLFDKGVAVLPGSDFSVNGKEFIRIAYCQPMNQLKEAIRIMKEIFNHGKI